MAQKAVEMIDVSARELTPQAHSRSAQARRQTRRRLGVIGVVIALAIGFLLYKALTAAVTYFKTVDQALAARASLGTSTFQLEGLVAAHSISRPSATTVSFVLKGSGHHQINVTNTGAPPELFQGNVPVVIVGHFAGSSNQFFSDQILVKHSNTYIAAHPTRVRAPNGSVR